VQVEHRLPAARADVHDHAVIGQPDLGSGFRDEVEHSLRVGLVKCAHVAEGIDVSLRDDEYVNRSERVDVVDRDETVGPVDPVPLAREPAEEAVVTLRQQGCPPP
jgi:hypothetical protein